MGLGPRGGRRARHRRRTRGVDRPRRRPGGRHRGRSPRPAARRHPRRRCPGTSRRPAQQELAGIRSRERAELARELHDTVAHHVSAIAVRAQAGRVLAASQPGAAADALVVIEEEASRALEEMRSMVGALRQGGGGQSDLAPQQGIRDIERLTRSTGPGPRDRRRAGRRPRRSAAVGRRRRLPHRPGGDHQRAPPRPPSHARPGRRWRATATAFASPSTTTAAAAPAAPSTSGFGLVGMAERAKLLGGMFEAGPRADGGWTVRAALPRHGATP